MSVIHDSHCSVTVQEIRVPGVDVAGFHGNKVFDEFVGGIHGFFEEGDYHGVELLLQLRVASEERFVEELAEDADKFVIDKTDAFQAWFFQSLDLLLDNNFKRSSANVHSSFAWNSAHYLFAASLSLAGGSRVQTFYLPHGGSSLFVPL